MKGGFFVPQAKAKPQEAPEWENRTLSRSMKDNLLLIKQLFLQNDTLVTREVQNRLDSEPRYALAYLDGLAGSAVINEYIVKPLMLAEGADAPLPPEELALRVIRISEQKAEEQVSALVEAICAGDTLLFMEGQSKALVLNTKGFDGRSIAEPDSEKAISGPREGFNEVLLDNLTLVRRRLRTPDFKLRYQTVGRRTGTKICIAYLESLTNPNLVEELLRRISLIDIDSVLDAQYIAELVHDIPHSPFRASGQSEKPDVVAGKLLEGRVAVFVDGSPIVLTYPYLFVENFQTGEDYYVNYYYATASRLLRILAFFLTCTVPALYVAIVAFHHEILPTPLLISIASARKNVPLPAALEAFVMLIMFDILRETGVRMPTGVGQAMSIVGAIIVGQAAVEAKLVAAPMIIIVAIAGITNLMVPKVSAAVIVIRMSLLALGSCFGMYGVAAGMVIFAAHIFHLDSMGVSQLSIGASIRMQDIKDTFLRAPWRRMITRPKIAEDSVRMKGSSDAQ